MSTYDNLSIQMQTRDGLRAPVTFWIATGEKRSRNCNGCGTAGWKGGLVPDTMWALRISAACDIHDWMYGEGTTDADKEFADMVFLRNMIAIINDAAKSGPYKWLHWLLVPVRERRAFKYYQVVAHSFSGEAAFRDAKLL